jgi:hypothetical protein
MALTTLSSICICILLSVPAPSTQLCPPSFQVSVCASLIPADFCLDHRLRLRRYQ